MDSLDGISVEELQDAPAGPAGDTGYAILDDNPLVCEGNLDEHYA